MGSSGEGSGLGDDFEEVPCRLGGSFPGPDCRERPGDLHPNNGNDYKMAAANVLGNSQRAQRPRGQPGQDRASYGEGRGVDGGGLSKGGCARLGECTFKSLPCAAARFAQHQRRASQLFNRHLSRFGPRVAGLDNDFYRVVTDFEGGKGTGYLRGFNEAEVDFSLPH